MSLMLSYYASNLVPSLEFLFFHLSSSIVFTNDHPVGCSSSSGSAAAGNFHSILLSLRSEPLPWPVTPSSPHHYHHHHYHHHPHHHHHHHHHHYHHHHHQPLPCPVTPSSNLREKTKREQIPETETQTPATAIPFNQKHTPYTS